MGDRFDVFSNSTVRVTGGRVGSWSSVGDESTLTISGGQLENNFQALAGSTVNIRGGRVGQDFQALANSTVNMISGTVGDGFKALPGSAVNLFGGAISDRFSSRPGAVTTISGFDFRIGDEPVAGLSQVGDVVAADIPRSGSLTGVLSDGTPLLFGSRYFAEGSLRLELSTPVPLGPSPINVPVDPAPFGLRAGQTLNLAEGGVLSDHFRAISGSHVNITGGRVGTDFEAIGSVVTVSGGSVGPSFTARSDAAVHISGGHVSDFRASDSTVTVSGGHVVDLGFDHDSSVNIHGFDFRIDGEPIPIEWIHDVGDIVSIWRRRLFTGILADGTPFVFAGENGGVFRQPVILVQSAFAPPGPARISVPGDPAPTWLREGQTLNVGEGGSLDDHFDAYYDSKVNITGGNVGSNFDVVDGEVTISGGQVGRHFNAFTDSTVRISGGQVGDNFDAFSGSTVHISGGSVGYSFDAFDGSTVHISGGTVGRRFLAKPGSTVHISGGTVGDDFEVDGATVHIDGGVVGNEFLVRSGTVIISGGRIGNEFRASLADVTIRGYDFRLDDQPVEGLDLVGDTITDDISSSSLFTGILTVQRHLV